MQLRSPAETRHDVAGLGNALIDALVCIEDDAVLDELGLMRGLMHPVDHARWHEAYDRLRDCEVEVHAGGSCANTIATLGLMGARAIFCGQVGQDQMGQLYARRMTEACGIHALRWTDDRPTGKCLSIISEGDAERTMLTDLGAAVHLDGIGDFDIHIRDSRLLHLTGYPLLVEPMRSRVMEALAVAEQAEIAVSIDVADPFVVSEVRELMWKVVGEFADVVFLNAEEAMALCGCAPEKAVHELGEVCELVVLKLGARGSLVKCGGDLVPVEAVRVHARDTTGAGDAYAGGFLYGLVQGWSIEKAAMLGNRVAALTVGQVGAVVRDRALLARAIEQVQEMSA